jgi:mannosyltransferase
MLTPTVTGTRVARQSEARTLGWTERLPLEVWALLFLTVLGALLRFGTLGSQSYWFDEAQVAHEVHLSFGSLMSMLGSTETSPPLYFVLAWLWAKVFGTGEVGLRSLSALAGTAVIPITYLCGRELVSRRAGVLAAALATVSPFLIWYSQEAREYMLLTAMCGASLLFFARSRSRPSARNLAGWALFSALALLTHFYAGFLVFSEAIWLLWEVRSRNTLIAAGAVAATEAALAPLAISDTAHPIGWITALPLSMRIQQVPVGFGFGTLDQSSWVTHGLLGAGILIAVLVALLIVGGGAAERRGAAIAGALAAIVILAPLVLAELGSDYYIVRALSPAWIPLAVVIGAACAAPRARLAGAAVLAALLAGFVYAGLRIDSNWQYQRPDWRGVAGALGTGAGPRAIVSYGGLATDPLRFYLRSVSWGAPGGPVAVSEVDIVGNVPQVPANSLPRGVTLIGTKSVNDFLVARFRLAPQWRLTPNAIGARVAGLLTPAASDPVVLIQQRS